jgi:hypothetical protein
MVETGDAQQTRCCTDEVIVTTGRSGPTHVNDPDYMDRNNPFEAPGGVGARKPDEPFFGLCVQKGQSCDDYANGVLAKCHLQFGPYSGHCRVVGVEALIACDAGTAPKCT